jgi:aconitate decarboxylase
LVAPNAPSCILSLPLKLAPALRNLLTTKASCSGRECLSISSPAVVLNPLTSILSFTATVEDFEPHLLTDPNRLALAQKVTTNLNSCKDLNALAPVSVEVTLHNGKTHHIELAAVLGNPARPLSKNAQITKFTAACSSAKHPLDQQQIQQLIVEIDHLGDINNINDLVSLTLNNH